jgi:peptide/nickel transport system ATP-binding protein
VSTSVHGTGVAADGTAIPLMEVDTVTKRFVKHLDLAEKIARVLGFDVVEEVVHAVDRVDMQVHAGEVVGLVGESGCGKSTLGRMVAGILEPSDGTIRFRGRATAQMTPEQARDAALKVQMIFQDPFASLNPRLRVSDIVGEAPMVHGIVGRQELPDYLDEVLLQCGLDPAYKRRYPHQFSGGQRQRLGIARALAVKPEFIVCDESVAALDVSIQAQVLNLFMDLREQLDLTYLFISHDLGVVEHLSDRVVIMYLGRVVESARTEALFDAPNHPYTQALLREVPRLETRHARFDPIEGEIPSPLSPPSGCHFHPRCPHATQRCRDEAPVLKEVQPGWESACHLNDG